MAKAEKRKKMDFDWAYPEQQHEYLDVLMWLEAEANLSDNWRERLGGG